MAITSILQTLMGMCLLNKTFKRSNLPLADINFSLIPFLLEKLIMTSLKKVVLPDYMMAPPIGMTMDQDKIALANITRGGTGTPYPHVYINF
jgi:hypothetical protein